MGVSPAVAPAAEDLSLSPTITLDPDPSPFFTAIGSATSQGVSVLKADQARSIFGVTGAGVKLGVISDSFNGSGSTPTLATQVAAGNLPGAGNPNGYTTGVTVVNDDSGTDEGRAMLEIVHDVAPGAQLYFHSAFNNTNPVTSYTGAGTPAPDQSIADAISGLSAVAGMRVIVDDVGYLTAPRFQDGPAAQAANAAFAKGIAYFSAAGNSATDATRVTTSVGVSGTVNWGTDGLLLMRVGGNSSGRAVLQWGEPYTSVSGSASTSNFSVAVTTANGAATYFTIDNQSAGQDPYEFIGLSNSGTSAIDVALRVTRTSGTAPVLMQLSTFGSGFTIIDADKTNAPTIYGQAAATGAVAVAASYWGTPTTVESFSSRGPTQILFDANGNPVNELRSTPLLTAPDGGTTTTSGFNPFYGTSAAAPHAAAVAALVMERFDQKGVTYSTRDVYQVLYDSAVDIGAAGFDSSSGYGRIDALAAVSAGRIWDGNGSTAGVSGTGSWSQAKWTLESTGDKPTGKFIRGQQAIFGSGTAAQASYSITVDGSYDVAGLQFARDTVTLASGSGALRLTTPTVEVASGLTASIAASLTGTSGLEKTGAGTLRLTGTTGYTGGTTVSAGTLVANGNLVASGPMVVGSGATLAGSGAVGSVTLTANSTIAPGNSPGTLTTGDVIFGAGGNYNWQITSASGSAGLQWDFIASSGSLTVNATVGNPFAINLWTLSGTGPDVSGPAANFNQLSNSSWKIGSFAGGITGFASNLFSIVTGSANGTAGFANAFLGTFSLATLGNDLNLVYSAPAVQNYDYVGGTGNFTTGTNWAGGSAPTGYGTINFAGPGGTATNDLVTLVNGLAFSGSASGGYVVAGNGMSVGGGGVVSNSAFAQTVQVPLALTAVGTVAANAGSVTLSGGLDTGGFGVAVAGSGDTNIVSLSGAGGLVKSGSGTLTLSGSNSYTGGTTLNGGRIVAAAALGSATNALVVNAGTLDTGAIDLTVGALSGSTGAVITTGSAAGTRTLTTAVSSGTSAFAGSLQNNGSGLLALAKSGSGTLLLSGSSSATGGITLNAGTLQVGGAAALGGAATPLAVNAGVLNTGTFSLSIGALSGSSGAVIVTATNAGTRTLTTTVASGSSIFAGTIVNSGSGVMALTKAGGGTLVIGGSNSNTGTTAIAAGTLVVGSGSTSGRLGNGPIVNNGALTFHRSDAYGGTVTNLISGSGSVRLVSGTLTLSGVNSYTGGTTLDGGFLQIGNALAIGGTANRLTLNSGTLNLGTNTISVGALGGSAGAIITTATNAGTRTLTTTVASGSSIFAGSLQNNGSGVLALAKAGAGTLVLAGSNGNTGATTISAGTLRVGAGGTSGRLGTGTITNNGGLVFDRSDDYGGPLGNSITGTGALTLAGGALTLTGSSSFTGSTTISAGTLQVGNGGTAGRLASGTIANSGALVFSRSDAYGGAVANVITGTGSLTLSGGTLTLTAVSPFSGVTAINAGTLQVNGSLASSEVAVNAGGQLTGSGAVGGLVVNTGGTLMPGTNAGSLTAGDVIFGAGGAYNWQLLSATGTAGLQWDLLNASGSLAINATTGNPFAVNLWTLSGTGAEGSGSAANFNQYASQSWTIGTFAGGISGFDSTLFSIVTEPANGTGGFANEFTGTFSIAAVGNDLNIVYSAPIQSSYDYTGGTGSFSDPANWSLDTIPAGTPTITFSGAGGTATNDLLTAVTGITFTGSATGGYVLTGSGLAVGFGGIANDSAFAQTVQSPLVLAATGTVAANAAGLLLSGGVDAAGYGLAVTGAADTVITSLAGAGGLAKSDGGTLTLSGSNSFTGGVTLAGGRLVSGDPLALGGTANAVAVDGGTLDVGTAGVTIGALSGSAGGVITTATDAGTRTVTTVVASGSATYAGAIRDNGLGAIALAKSGSGRLTLSGSSGYSGGTTLSGGTLAVGNAAALGNATGPLAVNAGTLDVGMFGLAVGALSGSTGGVVTTAATAGTRALTTTVAAGTSTYAGSLRDNGFGKLALVKGGTGTLMLSGSNTATGGLTIAAGTLQVGHAAAISGTGIALAVNGGTLNTSTFNVAVGALSGSAGGVITTATNSGTRTLTTNVASGSAVFAGSLQNSGSGVLALTKTGAGMLVLTGSNGATGLTTISAGTLQIGAGGTSGRLGAGTITNNGALVFNRTDDYGGPLGNAISGTGSLTLLRGSLVLTGSSSSAGPTTISGGVLQVGNGGMTGRLGGGAITNNGAIVFSRADGYGGTVSNSISGTGSLTVAGGTLSLGGNNSFTGVTRAAGGVLALANTQALSRSTLDLYSTDSGSVALSAGVTAQTYTLGGLTGSRNLAIGGNTLSVGGNNQSTTYAGSISGSGGLLKTGTGTFTMTGGNSYSGVTTIAGGRLVGTTASLSGTINNYSTLEFAQATSGTFAGRIMNDQVGFGQTVKSGVGTLTLTGTVGGYISVNAGTLALSAASLAQGSINNSATVVFAQPTNGSLLGTIFGAGSVLKTGSGALTLQGGYVTGTTTVTGGRLVAPAATLRGPIVNNAAFEFSQSSNGEYASVLSGSGSLTKSGVGTLTLSGSSLVTGSTTISGGMLATGGAERLADTSMVSISGGASLRLGGNETIGALVGSGSVNLQSFQLTIAGSGSSTYSGGIFGSGGFTKAGSGLLTLSGSNGFLGATNLNMGTLVLSSSTALSPFTTLSIAAGSTLVVNRDVRVFSYTNSGGTISGTGRLLTSATATTGGTLTSLANTSGSDAYAVGLLKTSTATLVVSGSTSFTGGVVVEQGTIKLDAGGSFAASNVVDVRSGATLDLNGQSQTVAALAGSGSVALGGGTLTVDAATSTTFSGAIDGGSLVKSGSSALNLTGSASVSTAAVTSGLMSVNGTLAGTVAVAPGGTLGGAGTIVGDVSVSGTHAPGNSPEISTITGNLDYGAGATVVWEIAGNTATQGPPGSRTFDQILVGGNLAFSGSTAVVLSFYDQDPNSSWASTVDWNDEFWGTNHAWTLWQVSGTTTGFANLSLQTESWLDSNGAAFGTLLPNRSFSLAVSGNDVQLVYAVPEPATLALAAAGIAASGLMLRRRRQG